MMPPGGIDGSKCVATPTTSTWPGRTPLGRLFYLEPGRIYLQKSASIQPRTSPSKFGENFNSIFIRLLTQEQGVKMGPCLARISRLFPGNAMQEVSIF